MNRPPFSTRALGIACRLGRKGVLGAMLSIGLAAAATPPVAAAEPLSVGMRSLTITTKEPGRVLPTLVWYPAAPGGEEVLIGDNPVIVGTHVRRDAPVAPGRHPLLLISHGSGGNGAGLSWLTTRLAARGYMVVAMNHPGTTSGDSNEKLTMELWHRPKDISATLDHLLAAPDLAPSIDPKAVGALGFSLGGYDVLALAGAEQRRFAFAEYCNRNRTMMGCAWLRRGGVDFAALDPRFDENHRDTRIRAVIAVDPAFTPSYDDKSLASVTVPVGVLNLGTPSTTPGIIEGRAIVDLMPNARLDRVPDTVHFSFLGLCKPDAARLLAEAGDEPICTDVPGGRDRAALHDDMTAKIFNFLDRMLPVGH
jgi:predicted dienelactone hydrolase